MVFQEEPFVFNNIKEKAISTVDQSKNCEDLKYNLEEYSNFVKNYAQDKLFHLDFIYNNTGCIDGSSFNITFNMTLKSEKTELVSNFVVGWSGTGGAPITLILSNTCGSSGPDVADILADDSSGEYDLAQLKWNITAIPAGVTIIDAKQCLYWGLVIGSPDNDVNVSRVNDQTWDENSPVATIRNQALTNISLLTWNSTTEDTWGCTNVTKMLQTDYNLGNNYASFRFEDPNNPVGRIAGTWDDVSYPLSIGDYTFGPELLGEDRECTCLNFWGWYTGSGHPPMLIITYIS
jgi:hypothetical protein